MSRIELTAFKSFADKTEFVFDAGVTALVGPNGCGKSNVVDAIRWALGEQSARKLRGKEMADVIFTGTARRRPSGFAEVNLHFANGDGSALKGIDTQEVVVTRRAYRNGEGEYFINHNAVRLKDVRELFMDTGLGASSYSVIEQGHVDFLLRANAAERRAIFDEAAGISRFKAQRKEAMNKLSRAQEHLARQGDLIAELASRLRSVKIQAGRAKRYKEYTEELARLRAALLGVRFRDLSTACAKLDSRVDTLGSRRDDVNAELGRLEVEKSALEVTIAQVDEKLSLGRAEERELITRRKLAEHEIENARNRISELVIERDDHGRKLEQLQNRLSEEERELEQTADRCLSTAEQRTDQRKRLEEIDAVVTDSCTQIESAKKSQTEVKRRVMEQIGEATRVERSLADAAARLRALEGGLERLASRQAQHQQERSARAGELHQIEAAIAQLEGDRDELNTQHERARAEIAGTESDLGVVREKCARLQQEYTSLESRRDLLRDLEARLEGVGEGARAVLKATGEGRTGGVIGMVAQVIEVAARDARVVETALGERAGAILTSDTRGALAAMRLAQEQGAGGVIVIPADRLNAENAPADGSVASLIGGTGAGAQAVRGLLGGCLLAEDLAAALEAAAARPDFVHVTRNGELVDGPCLSTAGVRAAGGLIERRSQLRDVGARLADLEIELRKNRDLERESAQCLAGLTARAQELARRLAGISNDRAATESKRAALSRELQRLEREVAATASERQALQGERDEVAREAERLGAQRDGHAAGRERDEQEMTRTDERIADMEAARRDAEAERSRVHEQLAQAEAALAAASREVQALKRSIEERQGRIKSVRLDIETAESRQRQLAVHIEDEEKTLQETGAELQLLKDAVARLEVARGERKNDLLGMHEAIRTTAAELAEVDAALTEERLAREKVAARIDSIAERAREELSVDADDLERAAQEIEETFDEKVAEERAEELRTKIRRIGPVNMEALAEQESLEERLSVHRSNREDIEKAIRHEREIIRRFNTVCRERFRETFEAVRGHFQGIFRKLFGGGKADLILEDDEEKDLLERGVEVMAKPPGKEPQTLTLLSGGEKVLTTVALLFAMFKARPSPFCLLDEVDAALDESNIDRFLSLIREFLPASQFLLITHSRRTMSMADVLYGITMQERGISRKVEVRMTDVDDWALKSTPAAHQRQSPPRTLALDGAPASA